MIILDGKKMETCAQAYPYLKRKLDLPDWFVENLDALYDVLTAWRGEEIQLVNLDENNEFQRVLRGVFRDAESSNLRLSVHIFP